MIGWEGVWEGTSPLTAKEVNSARWQQPYCGVCGDMLSISFSLVCNPPSIKLVNWSFGKL